MGRALICQKLICQKSAILTQGSACPPRLGSGELGGEATQEPRNSSGGPGSPSRTRMRSSSSGSSGAFLSRLQTFSVRFGATFVFPIRRLCRFLFPFSCLITALSMKDKQNGSIRIAAGYLLSIMAKIR